MLLAENYYTLYLIIVVGLTIFASNRGNKLDGNMFLATSLCVFMAIFIGFRPSSKLFVDMGGYKNRYYITQWNGFDFDVDNIIFDNLYNYMGASGIDVSLFFLLIASIYFGCMLIACRKFFPNQVLLAFLVCLAAFSTFSYATNGIKAGAAASIFLVALAYNNKLIIAIPLALISWGFHHAMQLPVAAYIIAILIRKNSLFYGIWFVCLVLSIFHVTFFQSIFAGWTDDQGAGYLNVVDAAFVKHKGFRYDFAIYSVFPIIMGYYAISKLKFKDKLYNVLLRTYIFTNAIWLLCMYAPFTNRIAYLSWLMYPIVLIYPCFKNEGTNLQLVNQRNLVVWLHLSFTLFMTFIYY